MRKILLGLMAASVSAPNFTFASGANFALGPAVTSGTTLMGEGAFSVNSNPAAARASHILIPNGGNFAIAVHAGASVEYGNLDEVFEVGDKTATAFDPDSGDISGSNEITNFDQPVSALPNSPAFQDFLSH